MGVDVAHLVREALGDASNHVADKSANGAESGNILAVAVVHLNVDDVLLGVREADIDVTEVLGELTARALDSDLAGLNVHLDWCMLVQYPQLILFLVGMRGMRSGMVFLGFDCRCYAPPSGIVSDSSE
jgi:hypothetical protein